MRSKNTSLIANIIKKSAAVLFASALITLPVFTGISAASEEAETDRSVVPVTFSEGDGSYENPYIVRTKEDLMNFANDVNCGNSYKDKFVKQVCDIDMSGVNFTPIGVFGCGSYFEGTYFGGGHVLTNFTSYGIKYVGDIDSANNALFGLLLGDVYSLGIASGEVEGACIGAIASHTASEGATIANCYSNVLMKGARNGGIADNFAGGRVIGCWSTSYDINGDPVPLVSYSADTIALSYCAGEIIGEERKMYETLKENVSNAEELINNKNFYKSLNKSSDRIYEYYAPQTAITYYESKNGATEFIEDNSVTNEMFEGRGSKYSPYKINDAKDLVTFSYLVNTGMDFKDEYVKQTASIDLNGFSFIPIGLYDGGNYFYGTYDGSGYSLDNLTIDTQWAGRNNALFGTFGGILINLHLNGGFIEGNCCASFASHSATYEAMIVNCYSTAYIYGRRSGGIADNFFGYIIGCWYHCPVEALPIVSYNGLYVKFCYNNYKYVLPETYDGESKWVYCIGEDTFETEGFREIINANMPFVAAESGISLSDLTKCYSTDYNGAFVYWFTHPVQMLKAYKYYILAIASISGSALVIFFTLRKQIRSKKNED